MVTLEDIWKKWQKNADTYKTVEVGSGIHSLVKDVFLSEDLLNLRETPKKTGKFGTFTHDTAADEHGRPDFVIYAADDVTIPVEVKCFGRIKEGIPQLFRYQLDYSKQYGILTDGWEWRFYRAGQHSKFFLQEIFENKDDFLTFWNDYIKPEHYYSGIFNPKGQLQLFDEKIDLNDSENRKIFFDDTTNLIHKFMVKMRARGTFADYDDKKALETSYSYLIQFILFKVIVDNGFKDFTAWYKNLFRIIGNYIYNSDNYSAILNNIKVIADYVSMHIYKPFAKEQEKLNNLIFKNLSTNLIIEDISPWLDNLIFIDKYNFGNLRNEIFGFIYENYLKDLYHNENKGQYFTDPEVVNVMLEEVGYTAQNLKNQHDKLSIIDPSCGAGTFLYSAVDAIIGSFGGNFTKEEAQKIENIVSKNVFGLDIEEFPLYLAEMSILMKLLPLIINDDFENPIDEKIKVFKTKDSISEFLDAGIGAVNPDVDFPTLFDKNSLGYDSFVRDNQNLQEMIESMQGHNGERMRFDFVVGNPPYVDYNSCS
ncbi:MAG: N-6 DNA methylase, partial [Bacteroidales bacterium]|nr:N-6 DNA methylase [Bacteroidales bacterium]